MSNAPPSLGQYAEAYDQPFCGSPIRREVWQIADRIFSRGMRLVDIGCGTGEDAIHFARRGIDVTAIDVSPAMIAQVKLKSGGSVRCKLADMRTCAVEDIFDGVFSNFSALNYVPDHSLRKILNALGRGVHLKKVLGLRALRPHARAGAPRAIRSSQCCQTNGSLVVFPPPDGRARGSIRFRMADA